MFFFKQKTAYEMRISDWSSDVCSSDLIALKSGEAWFQVAKDRARPFVVEIGDVRVRAVGTAFSVRREAHGVDVQGTEGVVGVWRVGDEANIRRVSAGKSACVEIGRGSCGGRGCQYVECSVGAVT